jgi:CubicO group peptidase (beta-lactamase class C family)/GNAT superfamily N-acetyltransferase
MDTPQIVIRRLSTDDLALYRDIRLEGLRLNPEAFGSTLEREEAQPLEWFADRLANSDLLGAFADGALVGVAAFGAHQGPKASHKGFLWGMYVRPGWRRMGIGRQLVQAIIDLARERVEILQISSVGDNDPSRRLYTSMGFVEYGVERNAYKYEGRYYDEIHMAMDLTNTVNKMSSSSTNVLAVLQPYVDSGVLAGAVALVADRDRTLSVDAVGWADIAAKRPMAEDSVFWIASMTKPMNATLVMMLVDEGKVSIDEPVATYLPEMADLRVGVEQGDGSVLLKRPGRPVTVRDVLSHTSGMPFASAIEVPTLDRLPLDVAVRSYAITPLRSEPGARYEYANAGSNTAGRVVEVVSGMPYWDFMRTRLLEPLGMAETTFWPSAAQIARLAKPYKPGDENSGLQETTISQMKYPLDDPARQPFPAGGLFATAEDVARFCRMVLGGGVFEGKRLLSQAAVAAMTSRQTPPEIEARHGLGWVVSDDNVGHGGALSTYMSIYPALNRLVVYLVQHAGYPGNGGEALAAFQSVAKGM